MLAAATSRWPFTWRHRGGRKCKQPAPDDAPTDHPHIPIERVTVSLGHHLEVGQIAQYLSGQLDCDSWHVAFRDDHRMVVLLTQGGSTRYAVSCECSPAVEKAVYHGNLAWSLTIIPHHSQDNLPAHKTSGIQSGLAHLHG